MKRTASILQVTATDLAEWSGRLDLQALLPVLVRRLVWATVDSPSRVDFRGREGTQLAGFDGIVEVIQGRGPVPAGRSVWELSTQRSPKTKADEDYAKRTTDPGLVNPATATYVALSSRRYPGKDTWARERRGEEVWSDVVFLDADDLEQWLERAPAVHAWFARAMGKRVEGAIDLDTFWTDWSRRMDPPASEALVIGGRKDELARFTQWLEGEPGVLTLRADTRDEALAFFAAAVRSMPEPEGASFLARSIVAATDDALRELLGSNEPLVIALSPSDVGELSATWSPRHHVLVPTEPGPGPNSAEVRLGRIDASAAGAALVGMGLDPERARELVDRCGRRLGPLLRLLPSHGPHPMPAWAQASSGPELVPLLLAGAWDADKDGDQAQIAELADRPYSEVSRSAVRWASEADPPLRRSGESWSWVSRADAWPVLCGYIQADDVERFRSVVRKVLGASDPRFELPPDERWLAAVKGKVLSWSTEFRHGLAEALILLATQGDGLRTQFRGPDIAASAVRELLAARDQGVWATLADLLPELVEAAPDALLDAVESTVLVGGPVFTALFQEEGAMGHSPHTGLLWALERLAWSQGHFVGVVTVLGRLAALDPGGHLANRPLGTLREIFLPWMPQTTACPKRRAAALDALARSEPDVAWKLCVLLLPSSAGDHSTPILKPRWRDWHAGWRESVTHGEYWEAVGSVVERLSQWVGDDGQRWADVVAHFHQIPDDARRRFLEPLAALDPSSLSQEGRLALWRALRGALHDHRSMPDADWTLKGESLDKLDSVYRRFRPESMLDRYGWLFGSNPELPDVDGHDYDAEQAALEKERRAAVESVHADAGSAGLEEFASAAEVPWLVGRAAGGSGIDGSDLVLLASRALDADDRRRWLLGLGIVDGRFKAGGWGWVRDVLDRHSAGWNSRQRAGFACALPFSGATWDIVDSWEHEARAQYWARVGGWSVDDIRVDAPRAIEGLLSAGRPYAALGLASRTLHRSKDVGAIPSGILAQTLDAAAKADPGAEAGLLASGGIAHQVQDLLVAIDGIGDVDPTRIALMEWTWLSALQHGRRPARVLHAELARDPKLFAQIVSFVFRSEADTETRSEPTEAERARATHSWRLLEQWHTVPGTREDLSIDAAALMAWVVEARRLCSAMGRGSVGDSRIGQLLAFSPVGDDGEWPHEAVRDVLDRCASPDLDRGLAVGVHNRRGAYTKALGEGGKRERDIAATYRRHADRLADYWPRTSRVLRLISESFLSDARREDIRADVEEDE